MGLLLLSISLLASEQAGENTIKLPLNKLTALMPQSQPSGFSSQPHRCLPGILGADNNQTRNHSSNVPGMGSVETVHFPVNRVWSAYLAISSSQKRNSYDNHPSIFLDRGCIGVWGDCLNLDSPLDGISSISFLTCSSCSRASYLIYKGTWEGEIDWYRCLLPPRTGIYLHFTLYLRCPSLQENRGSPRRLSWCDRTRRNDLKLHQGRFR